MNEAIYNLSEYGQDALLQLNNVHSRLSLILRRSVTQGNDTSLDVQRIRELNDIISMTEKLQERLSKLYFEARNLHQEIIANSKPRYFRFFNEDEIVEISEEDAKHFNMLAQDEEEKYENDDI